MSNIKGSFYKVLLRTAVFIIAVLSFVCVINPEKVYAGGIEFSERNEGGSVNNRRVDWSQYNAGTTIYCMATPDPGYEFYQWYRDGAVYSKSASIYAQMPNSDPGNGVYIRYEAEFVRQCLFGIKTEVNYDAYGSASPEFTRWKKDNANTYITLTATPQAGYIFSHWRLNNFDGSYVVDKYSTNPTISVRMPVNELSGDILYTAYFVEEVGVYGVAGANGRVTPSYTRWQANGDVSLSAIPNEGYDFLKWEVAPDGSEKYIVNYGALDVYKPDISFRMGNIRPDSNITFTALFKETTGIVAEVENEQEDRGSVSPAYTQWQPGSSVTLVATPKTGYRFDHWTIEPGGTTNNQATISVPMTGQAPSGNITYTAHFRRIEGSGIKTAASPVGGGQTTPSITYWSEKTKDTDIQLTARAARGYEFTGWLMTDVNGDTIYEYSTNDVITVHMPFDNPGGYIIYTAKFKKNSDEKKNPEIKVTGKQTEITKESFLHKWKTWLAPKFNYIRETIASIAGLKVAEDANDYEKYRKYAETSDANPNALREQIEASNGKFKHTQSVDNPLLLTSGEFSLIDISGIEMVFVPDDDFADKAGSAQETVSGKYGEYYSGEVIQAGEVYFVDESGERIHEEKRPDLDATCVFTGIDTADAYGWMMLYTDLDTNEFIITPVTDADGVVRFTLPDRNGGYIVLIKLKVIY